ncbi:MAG: hypothetical protein M0D55_15215 [Elusimicrobiota bacterium]|nr:MAG: hypothetical protein M0D55_15215 [Elusimicrobiota bacterium]
MRKILVLACALSAGLASAQNVRVQTGSPASPVTPILPFSAAPGGAALTPSLSGLGLSPSLSAPSISAPSIIAAPVAALRPQALAAIKPAAAIAAARPDAVQAKAVANEAPLALNVLSQAASVGENKNSTPASRNDALFDGAVARAPSDDAVVAAAPARRGSFLKKAALGAAVWIAHPGIALAAAPQASVEPGAMALVGNYGPLSVMIAAVLGALFGLWQARSKDGSPANAGQALSGSLSAGAIAGAAAYVVLDLTKLAFLGAGATALAPLTAAVATAALAQTAFAAKFMDPATTPADRIIGAFPAVAAAFGLSVGAIAFLPALPMLTVATWAIMLTGAATALYTAMFRLEKSVAGGPR